jgi:ribosomal protein S27AE
VSPFEKGGLRGILNGVGAPPICVLTSYAIILSMIRFALRHTKLTSLICVVLILFFIILIIRALAGGTPSYLFTISILGIIAVFIFRAYVISVQKREIVRCPNCGNRMTRQHFQRYGCQKCHTDLFINTGKYAK